MKLLRLLLVTATIGFPLLASSQEPMQPSGVVEAMMSNDGKNCFWTAASANMFEIDASKLAQIRATDPVLKDFAAMMIKDHRAAIEKLKALAVTKNLTWPTISRARTSTIPIATRWSSATRKPCLHSTRPPRKPKTLRSSSSRK